MQIDIEQHDQLLAYLHETGRISAREQPRFHTLAGGVSNKTVLVERPAGNDWVLKQALEKLRVAVDWFSSPARIHREAAGLRWLAQFAPAGTITPFVFEDHANHILAMSAVPPPHANWKTLLLAGDLQHDHIVLFGQLLGAIHRASAERRTAVAAAFDDRSFFETLRVEPYYAYSAAQVPAAAPFIHALIAETRATRATLVHGDYSPKNLLVHNRRLVLLDHEVIHFGDPAFDLGFSLTHLLSKAHHLAARRADFATAAHLYWQTYRATIGDLAWATGLEARAVRHTLACLLARVAGRSPLEYLSVQEQRQQRDAVVALIHAPPATVAALVTEFCQRID